MIPINDRDEVKSILKACNLLDFISDAGMIGITELSKKSNIKRTTVFRILETLKKAGLVDQDPSTQQFFLTLRVVTLANRVLKNLDIQRLSRPALEKFVRVYGKSILLTIYARGQIVPIDRVDGNEAYRVKMPIGFMQPAYCTSGGKAILAYLPQKELYSLLGDEPFAAFTSSTITDWATLNKDLRLVRERGYAVDIHERAEDIVAVAVPIFDHNGNVVGSIAVLMVAPSIDGVDLTVWGKRLIETGHEISKQLGWTGFIKHTTTID